MRTGAVGVCCLLAGVAAWAAGAGRGSLTADPVDEPAAANARASQAVLLGVTRAGARLIAVGERGTIVLSDDEGRSWRQAPAPLSVTLTAVQFPSDRRGYAVGHAGTVLRSDDAGASWTRLATDQPGGQGEGPDRPLLDLSFTAEARGFVVGASGTILSTADGGGTWRSLRDRLAADEVRHLYGVRASAAEVFVVGEEGAIYRSRDGGAGFAALASPYPGSLFGVALGPSPGQVLIFGLRGRAFWSTDSGDRWRERSAAPSAAHLSALPLSDGSVLLADQAGRLFRTRAGDPDGGALTPLALRLPAGAQGMVELPGSGVIAVGARGALAPFRPGEQRR